MFYMHAKASIYYNDPVGINKECGEPLSDNRKPTNES